MTYDDGTAPYDDEAVITSPRDRKPFYIGAVVLVAAAIAGTALALTVGDDDDDAPRAVASATVSPTPSPSPTSESPTPEPSASDLPLPEPSSSAVVVVVSPSPSRAPSARATVRPTSSTRPASGYPAKGLVLEVTGEPVTGDPPAVRFRIRVRDNDGSEVNGTIDYGDGARQTFARRPPGACRTTPTSPPPGYQAQPIDKSYTLTHPYERSGRFTVTITVDTERQCEGTPRETATRTLIVEVPERESPAPAPSPASPAPSASPSPSASRSA